MLLFLCDMYIFLVLLLQENGKDLDDAQSSQWYTRIYVQMDNVFMVFTISYLILLRPVLFENEEKKLDWVEKYTGVEKGRD